MNIPYRMAFRLSVILLLTAAFAPSLGAQQPELTADPDDPAVQAVLETKPSTPMQLVRAAHVLALEPERFADCYAIAPYCDKRTKAGKEEWAAFIEAANGKAVLTLDDFQSIEQVANSIKKQVVKKI